VDTLVFLGIAQETQRGFVLIVGDGSLIIANAFARLVRRNVGGKASGNPGSQNGGLKVQQLRPILPREKNTGWDNSADGQLTVANDEPIGQLPATVVSRAPTSIDKVLNKTQFVSLVRHMLNRNPVSHFLVVWHKDGVARYAKAKSYRDAEAHAGWTYDTITREAKSETSMGLYPKNENNESTWGALDFDAHDPARHHVAEGYAVRAFTLLLEYADRYLILSASGRGYHVFILANEPRPIVEWTKMLKNTADTIGAPIQDGVCEIFPSEKTQEQEVGRAIRIPGSLNPTTGEAEKIVAHTLDPLIDQLAKRESASKDNPSRHSARRAELSLVKETNSYSFNGQGFFAASTPGLIDDVIAKCPVARKGTRNSTMAKLVGELFHKFGFTLSEKIVTRHYHANANNVRSELAEHLREFRAAWKSFRKKELARLSKSERERFDKLQTETQREAFLLCRSFGKLKKEFPVSQASLADRLAITRAGAAVVIAKLIDLGALKKTAPARPHVSSAQYRWTA